MSTASSPDTGKEILHLAGEGSLVPSSIEFKGYPPFGATDVDIYIKPENFHETLAGDLSRKDAAVLAVTQRPISFAAAGAPTTATAWKTIPSWYLLGTEDQDDHAGCATLYGQTCGRHDRGSQGLAPVADFPARQGRRADRGSRRSDQPRLAGATDRWEASAPARLLRGRRTVRPIIGLDWPAGARATRCRSPHPRLFQGEPAVVRPGSTGNAATGANRAMQLAQ
jgi:hypothetical protein